jgi:cytochrome c peroxidase
MYGETSQDRYSARALPRRFSPIVRIVAGLHLFSRMWVDAVLLLFLMGGACPASGVLEPPTEASKAGRNEPITPVPLIVATNPKRVALGERLFNDVRLSYNNQQSCATCHPIDKGGMDGLPRAVLSDNGGQRRNTPTIFNVGLNSTYNWDGVAYTLEDHTEIILSSPNLMNITWPTLLAKLRSDASYVAAFNDAYPQGLARVTVVDAIASFERSLLTPNARFDRYLRGERDALTEREQAGYQLFKDYGCVSCHQGVNVGGNLHQKFGVFERVAADKSATVDLGRISITNVPRDREVFRVPSLRNVAVTAPYFHDGRAPTLEDAVVTMVKAQLGRTLEQEEIGLIVDFLRTLTGEYQGRLLAPHGAEVR